MTTFKFPSFMNLKVLIVEDDYELRQMIADSLQLCEASTDQAENGDVAIRKIRRTKFDCIVSDVRMPGSDGLSLLLKIRAEFFDTPVILITGSTDISPSQARELGAFAFIYKPFKFDELYGAVELAMQCRNRSELNC